MEVIIKALERAMEDSRHIENAKTNVQNLVSLQNQISHSKSLVGVLPKIKSVALDPVILEKRRIIASSAYASHTHTFGKLRTKLLNMMEREGWNTMGMTSPTPGCGKTTLAINLSISIAQRSEIKVALVDMDYTGPGIAQCLGISDDLNADVAEVDGNTTGVHLIDPGIPQLLLALDAVKQSDETSVPPQVRHTIDKLRSKKIADYKIFDLPPILSSDSLEMAKHFDCILLVVEEGVTTRPELEETVQLLSDVNLAGIVLNKSKSKHTIV